MILLLLAFFSKKQLELKYIDRSSSISSNQNIHNHSSTDPASFEVGSAANSFVTPKESSKSNSLEPEIKHELQTILNTSSDGLIEIKTDKGDMVDLKNRFRTAPVATINETGEVVIRDYVSPPGN